MNGASTFNNAAAQLAYLRQLQTLKWNALVTKHMRLIREEPTHWVFLHATKGWRRISKRRLGVRT